MAKGKQSQLTMDPIVWHDMSFFMPNRHELREFLAMSNFTMRLLLWMLLTELTLLALSLIHI